MTVTVLPVRQPRLIHKPYLALAGLQVADVITTGIILSFWGDSHSEGNPLVNTLFQWNGLMIGLMILLAFKLAVVALFWDCQTRVRLASAIYGLVIVNNVLLLAVLLHNHLT